MQGQRKVLRRLISASSVVIGSAAGLGAAGFAFGNVYTGNAANNWDNTAVWQEVAFPDGIDSVADFSQKDITATNTISIRDVAGDTTIITGTLLAGDALSANTTTTNTYNFNLTASHTWVLNSSTGWAQIVRSNVGPLTGSSGLTPGQVNVNAAIKLGSNLQIRNDYIGGGTAVLTVAGIISDLSAPRGVEVAGPSTVALSGANTFTGGFTLSSGFVRLGLSSVVDNGSIVGPMGAGTVWLKGGILSSSAGAGAGDRTIHNHIVFDGDAIGLGGVAGGVGGNLTYAGNATLARNVRINPQTAGFNIFQGSIGDNGNGYGITIAGSGANGGVTLSGANTFSGKTVLLTNTKLSLNNANALQNTAVQPAGSGIQLRFLAAAGNTFTFGGLTGGLGLTDPTQAFGVAMQSESGGAITLRVGNNNNDYTYSGVLTGAGSLVKVGTGTQILESSVDPVNGLRANTYSGATSVAAGRLIINSNNTGAGAVSVESGATLSGSGTIASATTIDGTLAPGASTGLLTLQSNVTMGSGSTTQIELGGTARGASTGGYDAANVGGTLLLDGTVVVSFVDGFQPEVGAAFDLFDWGAVDASNFVVATDLILPTLSSGMPWDTSMFLSDGIVVAPEPGSMALLAVTGMALLRRRRSKTDA